MAIIYTEYWNVHERASKQASKLCSVRARRCGTNSNSTNKIWFLSPSPPPSPIFLHFYLLKAFIRFCRLWFLLDKTRATRKREKKTQSQNEKKTKPRQSSINAGCMHKLKNIFPFFVFTNSFVLDFLFFVCVRWKALIRSPIDI